MDQDDNAPQDDWNLFVQRGMNDGLTDQAIADWVRVDQQGEKLIARWAFGEISDDDFLGQFMRRGWHWTPGPIRQLFLPARERFKLALLARIGGV